MTHTGCGRFSRRLWSWSVSFLRAHKAGIHEHQAACKHAGAIGHHNSRDVLQIAGPAMTADEIVSAHIIGQRRDALFQVRRQPGYLSVVEGVVARWPVLGTREARSLSEPPTGCRGE